MTGLALFMLAAGSLLTQPTPLQRTVSDLGRECDLENTTACSLLAHLGDARPTAEVPYPRQIALLAKACKDGDQGSCTDWGQMLGAGPVIDHDWDRITKLWSDACELGNSEACHLLADAYARRLAEPKDSDDALGDVRLEAAFDALTFDVTRARLLARPFLGDHAHAEEARLLLACADMSEEHWQQATEKVSQRVTVDPAYAVLNELVRDRQEHPNDLWPKAYVRAWVRAGQPDLRRSLLFQHHFTPVRPMIAADGASKLGQMLVARERWVPWFGVTRAPPEPLPADVVQAAVALAGANTDAARLLALRILQAPTVPEALRAQARQAASVATEGLAQSRPHDVLAAFRAFVTEDPATGPFTPNEIDTIERMLALPECTSPVSDAYDGFSPDWIALDPANGVARALDAALDVSAPTWAETILARAQATQGHVAEADWARLKKAVHQLGTRLRDAGSLQERTAGDRLLSLEGALPYEPPRDRWSATAPDMLEAWPIEAMQEDVWNWKSEGEITFYEALSETLRQASLQH